MALKSDDIVPIHQVRARFTKLAEQVRRGEEKVITRNGQSYVALIDSRRLDHYHALERAHIHLKLLEEAVQGVEDVSAGRTLSVDQLRRRVKRKSAARSR